MKKLFASIGAAVVLFVGVATAQAVRVSIPD